MLRLLGCGRLRSVGCGAVLGALLLLLLLLSLLSGSPASSRAVLAVLLVSAVWVAAAAAAVARPMGCAMLVRSVLVLLLRVQAAATAAAAGPSIHPLPLSVSPRPGRWQRDAGSESGVLVEGRHIGQSECTDELWKLRRLCWRDRRRRSLTAPAARGSSRLVALLLRRGKVQLAGFVRLMLLLLLLLHCRFEACAVHESRDSRIELTSELTTHERTTGAQQTDKQMADRERRR